MLLSAFPAETLAGVLNLLFKTATLAPQLQNLQRSLKRIISIVRNNNIKNNSRKEHHWALRVPRVACDPPHPGRWVDMPRAVLQSLPPPRAPRRDRGVGAEGASPREPQRPALIMCLLSLTRLSDLGREEGGEWVENARVKGRGEPR